ncbi:hypothetical protein [Nitrosomonas sp. Nm34]|uniref:hypothetical protein n=1 Tax=Nitrosomonas sp. Nm34 TaxID=1881055 RepID=UPI0008E65A4A|nr:hypothetical protein [Nitrosomonas sp. Nm34]SFI27260.1 hypothetical protein SAMN05428978_10044 [Nitrosomonas sp. Nm34]
MRAYEGIITTAQWQGRQHAETGKRVQAVSALLPIKVIGKKRVSVQHSYLERIVD